MKRKMNFADGAMDIWQEKDSVCVNWVYSELAMECFSWSNLYIEQYNHSLYLSLSKFSTH